MKNVILVHLESLNLINYRMNWRLFPNIRYWESKSVSFSNYYASATSTLMVMSDLAYGDMYHNEPCRAMQWKLKKNDNRDSLLDDMKSLGYKIFVIGYPWNRDFDLVNENYFIGKNAKLDSETEYEAFKDRMITFLDECGDGFFLWVCNFISNISNNFRLQEDKETDGYTKWCEGFKEVDNYVGELMGLLEKKGFLDETTVIFYGDHGDDLFTHGRSGGLSHANEPYDTLIHTPLFVYDRSIKGGVVSDALISTLDIRNMINECINNRLDPYKIKRKYAVSRNLYAAQYIRSGVFNKCYAVTNGKYLLSISDYGMKMFIPEMDWNCQHNLLDDFDLKDGKLYFQRYRIEQLPFQHYKSVFNEGMITEISESFVLLRNELLSDVRDLYDYAGCSYRLWEIDDNRIAYNEQVQSADVISSIEYGIYTRHFAGKRIAIYGAGEYGKYCYHKLKDVCNIVGWFDESVTYVKDESNLEIQIKRPEEIQPMYFEYIFIAILNGYVRQEIEEELIAKGIPKEKIY